MVSNEKGLALPLVMFIMVVVTLLGVVLWHFSITDIKHVIREKNRMQAYYLARSGAQLIYDMAEADMLEDSDVFNIVFGDHEITVVILDETIIKSTAVVDDITQTLNLEQETGHWRN